MFTGIIESVGVVSHVFETGTNKSFWITSSISSELNIDQSVSHNGVCLTVEEIKDNRHKVTAVKETLEKSNLAILLLNERVNIERCLNFNSRLDGHLVQGHVDTTGTCTAIEWLNGSWVYQIQFPEKFAALIVEKGSVALNGISLTVFNIGVHYFSIVIIPFTYEHTTMKDLKIGGIVNLEFDIIGKYVLRSKEIEQGK